MKAFEISKWILEKNPNLRLGTYDGNVKLNKLLYFSNLMYYTLYDENLIDDKFEKWDNGPVIKSIYADYRYNDCAKIKASKVIKFDDRAKKVIDIINFVYSDKTAKTLSDETHNHSIWIEQPKNGYIDFSRIDEKERKLMRKIYSCYNNIDFDNLKLEIVNGIKYYYFKNELEITDEIIKQLENNVSDEEYIFLEISDGELIFS
ncbi:Panacea domain-containing protein [Streptobacillus moniliformis]|uniref:Panacea domain-containing protein n=1 Tax=Streptobacillus moniliformis TaxID=34105 RepID=UPI0007E38A8D|nr:type II toxin-antitoxin system antitoxin SocA domain-containing protein [Streptobacillus moniliformis]